MCVCVCVCVCDAIAQIRPLLRFLDHTQLDTQTQTQQNSSERVISSSHWQLPKQHKKHKVEHPSNQWIPIHNHRNRAAECLHLNCIANRTSCWYSLHHFLPVSVFDTFALWLFVKVEFLLLLFHLHFMFPAVPSTTIWTYLLQLYSIYISNISSLYYFLSQDFLSQLSRSYCSVMYAILFCVTTFIGLVSSFYKYGYCFNFWIHILFSIAVVFNNIYKLVFFTLVLKYSAILFISVLYISSI